MVITGYSTVSRGLLLYLTISFPVGGLVAGILALLTFRGAVGLVAPFLGEVREAAPQAAVEAP
jgi:hypothetical protein